MTAVLKEQFDRPPSLRSLFAPESVAIIGALDDAGRAGGRLVKYLTEYGFEGRVYFVNPQRQSVAGRQCFASMAELPESVDLALISLSAQRTVSALREAGEANARAAVVFATGFAEAGAAGRQMQHELETVAGEYPMRVLGPNTAGIRAAGIRLFGEQGTNLATVGYRLGTAAVVSQSGALGGYFGSTYLSKMGVGTRYFVDTGNEVDIDVADCILHLATDEAVSSIAVMLESCRDGRKLATAVATVTSLGKPVVFLKVGRTQEGMEAARSHTAALASSTEVLEAELSNAGASVVKDELQLVDSLTLHSTGSEPAGRRVGIVTPSGGFGVLALDVASEQGLEIPAVEQFSETDQIGLGGSSNPLELAGLATSGTELLEAALRHMGSQANIDAVILWHPHRLLRFDQQEPHLLALAGSREETGKPHFHCGLVTDDFRAHLLDHGLVSFETPTRLMRAIRAVAPATAARFAVDRSGVEGGGGVERSAAEVRDWLRSLGIEVVETETVRSADEALRLQEQWGSPVMLKVETAVATHKTERGLVMGPVAGSTLAEAFVRAAAHAVMEEDPDSQIVIQRFERGIELALGAYYDPTFGPTVMVAHGGIFMEVLKDAAFAAAPVSHERAAEMLRSLRIYPAIAGSRGTPADLEAVLKALVAISNEAARFSNVNVSLDINPLIVRSQGKGAVAVDVRLVSSDRVSTG